MKQGIFFYFFFFSDLEKQGILTFSNHSSISLTHKTHPHNQIHRRNETGHLGINQKSFIAKIQRCSLRVYMRVKEKKMGISEQKE